jgi:LacI family transcriptional regulator
LTAPDVAVVIPAEIAYGRGLLRGIRAYLREHEPWRVYLAGQARTFSPETLLSDWAGDGVVLMLDRPWLVEPVRALACPVVDACGAGLLDGLPAVRIDDQAVARLARDHLVARGYRHFGFVDDARYNWSTARRDAFVRLVDEAGCQTEVYQLGGDGYEALTRVRQMRRLRQWVVTLTRPTAVFAANDIFAQQVLEACRAEGIAVPEELAVLGVDNDELLCDLAEPALSSVVPDAYRGGYLAAELLDSLIAGGEPPDETILVAPLGIADRRSTDCLALDDPHVTRAIAYIREHACRGLKVTDVLQLVPLTRRVLDSRFRQLLGRTVHEEIQRIRLARVRKLLLETELPLARIAELSGFRFPEHLSAAFKKDAGVPPGRYREMHRQTT